METNLMPRLSHLPDGGATLALPRLQSGNDWLEHLLCNGWNAVEVHTGRLVDHVSLQKGNEQIIYFNTYEHGSTFQHTKEGSGGKYTIATINGIDLEGDPQRFILMAAALGWVSLATAAKTAKEPA